MKLNFPLLSLLASASAIGTADWSPCTKQDCSSSEWICCDVTKAGDDGLSENTGTMLCVDPTSNGIVPGG